MSTIRAEKDLFRQNVNDIGCMDIYVKHMLLNQYVHGKLKTRGLILKIREASLILFCLFFSIIISSWEKKIRA